MDGELAEITGFMHAIHPFDTLNDSALLKLVKSIHIEYVRSGETMPPNHEIKTYLYIVRKGSLSYFDDNQELLSKYTEGDICSVFMLPDALVKIHVKVDEDTLLYAIAKADLFYAIAESPEANTFFNQTGAQRLKKRMQQINAQAIVDSTLSNSVVEDFYNSPAGCIEHNTSIQQTAVKMSELGFSCLIVVKNNHLVGIVTDKDIRKRCVAQGRDIHQDITTIMTRELITVDVKASAFDALEMMTTHAIHHLPVTKQGQISGLVTVTDLMNHESSNTTNLTSLIKRAKTIDELSKLSKIIPKLQIRLAKLGTSAEHVGNSISVITMAITIRLIKMAEQKYGPAPVSYAWLGAGSQARHEQLAHSDQDNGLIISDNMKPEDDTWFKDVANFVNDGLDKAGFIYCPGNIMASNRKWRQPKAVWSRYFNQWINQPEPEALLHSSIFFDLTTVYGDESLLNDVRQQMLKKTKSNSVFIAHMTKNALQLKPPLGFFRDFVLVENGANEKALDLKHNGIAPIVDLARIYALQEGVHAVNTLERLRQVAGTRSLSSASARSLIDAFEFLGQLRLNHQAKLIQNGKTASNYMHPKEISRLEREHLKEAFKVIKTLQDSRQVAY